MAAMTLPAQSNVSLRLTDLLRMHYGDHQCVPQQTVLEGIWAGNTNQWEFSLDAAPAAFETFAVAGSEGDRILAAEGRVTATFCIYLHTAIASVMRQDT